MDLFRERESKISISPVPLSRHRLIFLNSRCLISFFSSFFFFFLYVCALKSYRVIFPLSLFSLFSLFPSFRWLYIDAWNAIRISEGSKPVDFVAVTRRLVCTDWDEVIWTSKEIRKRYRNEKFYTAVCPKHRIDGISGSFCVRPDAFSSHSLQRQISLPPSIALT